MERIAALLVRWGSALSLLVVIVYFVSRSFEVSPSDGVGVEMGMVIIAIGALLLLFSLVSIGVFGLWYAVISKRSESHRRFENERIIGTAFLVILCIIVALLV